MKRTRYKENDHGELGVVLAPGKPYKPRSESGRKIAGNTGISGKEESNADIARRLLPGFEESLANLRASGRTENDPQVVFHRTRIAQMQEALVSESKVGMSASKPRIGNRPPTPLAGGGGGDDGGGPTDHTGFSEFGDDDLNRAIKHGWDRHNPELVNSLGTRHPIGTTEAQAEAIIREIASREWVEPARGPVDQVLRSRLDAGEATLVERREQHINLFGRSGDVRYEIRLSGNDSTAHPIDGAGVVRNVEKRGQIIERQLKLGSRPIYGWDRDNY